MRAEQRTRLGIEDGLHQPLLLSERDGLAIGGIGEPADLEFVATVARSFFGQADACHLGGAVGAAWDVGLVERMHAFNAGDLLDADDALMACLVREPGRPDHVADSVEAWRASAAPFVDGDMALLDFNSLVL